MMAPTAWRARPAWSRSRIDWFVTAERRRQLDELLAKGGFDAEVKYGTVGAVAVDGTAMSQQRPRPAD